MRTVGESRLPHESDLLGLSGGTGVSRRLSAGDEEALGMLMDQYGSALLHFAHRLVGDMQVAEEICQETMLKAWQQAGSFRMDHHLRSWLFRVAKNQAIDCLRRRRTSQEQYQVAYASAVPVEQPEREAERSWLCDVILDALESLPEQYRMVIKLRFFEDLGYREIAERLQIPLGTVKSRINYGLRGLSRILVARGIDPESLDR